MSEAIDTIHYGLRVAAASQVLFLCVYSLLRQQERLGYLLAGNAFAFLCYLLLPFARSIWGLDLVAHLMNAAATSIPGLIWLLGRAFFSDDRKIPVWFWLAWFGYMALWLPDFRELSMFSSDSWQVIFSLLPQLVKLLLVLHVIYMAIEGRASDLVANRLKLRVPIAIGAAGLASMVIVVEIWAGQKMPMAIEIFGSIVMFIVALTTNVYLFNLRTDLPLDRGGGIIAGETQFDGNPETAMRSGVETRTETAADRKLLEKVTVLMETSRFYARHSVTLGDLAEEVGAPAYRLRHAINSGLGYRNFNQFLNEYRIREASLRLISQPELPILSIALDVGFRSLSSFNKAFREIQKQTPSAFRGRE